MGAGRGGGISGISTTGAGFRALGAGGGAALRALATRTGFARRAFAARGLARLLLAAFPDLRPDFPDERAFAMTAYATGGSGRRQPRRDL